MSITENVQRIRAELPAGVLLVAASKMNGPEAVREAVAAGVDACGENRVQELLEKNEALAYAGAQLHFIGHLQRNKVKSVVGLCDLIQSVDSEELLRLIDKRAAALGLRQDILLEVNIGGEEAKSGVAPSALDALLLAASPMEHLRVRGLMTVPPICAEKDEVRRYFSAMYKLFVDIGRKKYDNIFMDFLSMGMSADYREAVQEGANMVRVGSAIFGARVYPTQRS